MDADCCPPACAACLSDRFKVNVTPEGEQADLDQNICRLCLSGGSNVDRYGAGCLCLADDNYTGDYIDGSGCGERLLLAAGCCSS